MKKITRRMRRMLFVVLCLSAAMAVSVVAASADSSETQTDTSVAKVGNLYYDSLAEAFDAVSGEGTVELVKDATVSRIINIDVNQYITLDLNQYKITVTESFSSSAVLRNYGTLTIKGDDSGTIDASNKNIPVIINTYNGTAKGTLNIESGKIIGAFRAIEVKSGTLNISGGEISSTDVYTNESCAVLLASGTEAIISEDASIKSDVAPAIRASGAKLTVSDNADITGQFGVILLNSTGDNSEDAVHSSLTMTGGTIEATYGFALSGNNLSSAGCSAEITGGSLTNTAGETCIYWPMEGNLTIGGDATVEGGTGIEAKMGTITIKDKAQITGTGEYLDDAPLSGGSQADGSAILTSAQMYGENAGQYLTSPNLTVNIEGGILKSGQGNAVTVYNTEGVEAQEAVVNVTGGELVAADGKASVSVTMAKGDNTTELGKTDGSNSFTTSKSKTKVTVSSEVVSAAVDRDGKTSYYTDANEAMATNNENVTENVNIYILNDSEISREALESEKVKLTTAEGVELKISSNVDGMIVKETTNDDGSKTYELIMANDEQLAIPEVSIETDKESAHIGETLTLAAKVANKNDGVNYTYEWYKDGSLIAGEEKDTLAVSEGGSYIVIVTAYLTQDDGSVLTATAESAATECTITAHEYTGEWKYDKTGHWRECDICNDPSDMVKHTFGEWVVTKEPTIDGQGHRERSCTICGYVETEAIAAIDQEETTTPTDGSVATGDDFNMTAMLAVMALAAATAAGTVIYGRKKRSN